MKPHKETYKGCEIEISDGGNININGKQIDYEYDADRSKWSTPYLPYSQCDSLHELAQAIVRDSEEFVVPSE